MLVLVDEGRAGQHRLATTKIIAVLRVQVERGDGHVALHLRLLVDGELDLAVLDGLSDVSIQVEGGRPWPGCPPVPLPSKRPAQPARRE